MVQFGLFRMVQAAAGLSTAGPIFVVSLRSFETGDTATGLLLLALAAVGFVLPGYLLERWLDAIRAAPGRLRRAVVRWLGRRLPFWGRDDE